MSNFVSWTSKNIWICQALVLHSHACDLKTHCGLMMPYGDKNLGQHWLRWWLVAWRHQVITWTNVDWSSVKSSDIHIRAISHEMPQSSITKICLKITCLKFHSNFPGANELSKTCSSPGQHHIGCCMAYVNIIRPAPDELNMGCILGCRW